MTRERTPCVWEEVFGEEEGEEAGAPLLLAPGGVLAVSGEVRHLRLWESYFLRYYDSVVVRRGP